MCRPTTRRTARGEAGPASSGARRRGELARLLGVYRPTSRWTVRDEAGSVSAGGWTRDELARPWMRGQGTRPREQGAATGERVTPPGEGAGAAAHPRRPPPRPASPARRPWSGGRARRPVGRQGVPGRPRGGGGRRAARAPARWLTREPARWDAGGREALRQHGPGPDAGRGGPRLLGFRARPIPLLRFPPDLAAIIS